MNYSSIFSLLQNGSDLILNGILFSRKTACRFRQAVDNAVVCKNALPVEVIDYLKSEIISIYDSSESPFELLCLGCGAGLG